MIEGKLTAPLLMSPPSLPSGIVTFLLTDVEGSTRLWETYPKAMEEAVAQHDALIGATVVRHGGVLVKSRNEGDAAFCVFERPGDAVASAASIQRALAVTQWPAPVSLRVRIAIHTGAVQLREGDYFGPTVNRAARLRAVGHGGQILLSNATKELTGADLPEGIALKDMGLHGLKDLLQPERIWQLLHPELPSDFPPLNSLNATRNNLPQQTTSFIGREEEIVAVRQKLETGRLVTLTGIGGTGKTRLSLQAAAEMSTQYPDGVWFVELAPITEEALVPQAVAAVIGVREEPGQPLLRTLATALKTKRLLLVLDNCEHLVQASARLANTLLRECSDVKLLASSREALGVQGEIVHRTQALPLPDPTTDISLEALAGFASVRLFAERAGALSPNFELSEQNAPVIAHICRRLDGLPLAIELAAARARIMPVEQIAQRLDDCFRLLTGGSRTGLAHHQTLRAAIDWSYDLLSDTERQLFERLSVFAGGWMLEAAETVCAGEGIEDLDILDFLTSLADKSLVLYEEYDGQGRFRMLGTVRQYAEEKRQASPDKEATELRHAEYYLARAQEWSALLETSGEAPQAMQSMLREIGNMRAGMDRAMQRGDEARVVEYGKALARFFLAQGLSSEGDHRLEMAEGAARRSGDEKSLAQLLLQRGRIAWLCSDLEAAQRFYNESYECSDRLGDRPKMVPALINLGNVAWAKSDYPLARERYERALNLAHETNQSRYIAFLLGNLGLLETELGDFAKAARYCGEGLKLHQENRNEKGVADTLLTLAEMQTRQKQYEAARDSLEACRATFQALGMQHEIALVSIRFAELLFEEENLSEAESCMAEGMQIAQEINDPWCVVWALVIEGRIVGARGDVMAACALYRRALEGVRQYNMGRKDEVELLKYVGLTFIKNDQPERGYVALSLALREITTMGLWDRSEVEEHVERLRKELGAQAIERLNEEVGTASLELVLAV